MVDNFKYAENLVAPTNIQIEITDACNEKCNHCYNSWQIWKQLHACLTKQDIDKISDIFKENKIFWTTLTWWEPLLQKDLVSHAIQKFTKGNTITSLNSNLTLLDKDSALRYKDDWLDGILTSIISYDKDTHDKVTWKKGNFNQLLHWIDNAQSAWIPLSVSMVLTQYNKDDVYETWKFIDSLWIKKFFVTRGSFPLDMPHFENIAITNNEIYKWLDDLLRVKDEFSLDIVNILECYPLCFLAQDKRYWSFSTRKCSAWVTTATIWTDLQLRPCSHSNMKYGNVLEEQFHTIRWRMKDWRDWNFLPEKCKACKDIHRCTGWCRMDSLWRGDIKEMDNLSNLDLLDKVWELINYQDTKVKVVDLSWKKLRIVDNLIKREEENWYMIWKWANTIFINKDSWILVDYLLNERSFSLDSILDQFTISEKNLNYFLFLLFRNKIISIES